MNKSAQQGSDERAPHTAPTQEYNFDERLDRGALSTMKWEMELQQRSDPTFLCFGTADMDFRAPPAVLRAMERITGAGHLGYPFRSQAYYDAIIGYFDRHFGWKIEQNWISGNVGIYTSMEPIISELTDPGDEIIYMTPAHRPFPELIKANGRQPVAVPLTVRDGHYQMDFEALQRAISGKTRMLLLCSPHNPVGRIWALEELKELSSICAESGVIVVTDEVYCGLLFPGKSFTPFGAVSDEALRNSITLVSASKSFNLTGLRHSEVITANPEFMNAYLRGLKRTHLYYGGSIFGQAAAEAAFRDSDEWTINLMQYVKGNFEFLREYLQERLPMVKLTQPEATFLAWLDFTAFNFSDVELRERVERDARIVVTFGDTMGPGGEGHLRFNLGAPRSVVAEGLERLTSAFAR